MVARVMRPGAQVDHMLVLEGGQGRGKSTALRVLAGEWFSDAQLKLGDKDALLGLTNVWLYEVSELDAFSKADVTAVKAFLTTLNDHVRGVYERRVRRRPRQVVMAGTTNQQRYLRDMTGNRRFWPVTVGETVDTAKVAEWRDQLFAEALADFHAGERWWPTREEERELFVPVQDLRVIADAWLDELPARLALPKYADQKMWTTAELLSALGVSADKIDSGGQMGRRIEQIMHALQWGKARERRADGTRPHVYVRPDRAEALPASAEVPL
jgi:predicted P-loop ATPase